MHATFREQVQRRGRGVLINKISPGVQTSTSKEIRNTGSVEQVFQKPRLFAAKPSEAQHVKHPTINLSKM